MDKCLADSLDNSLIQGHRLTPSPSFGTLKKTRIVSFWPPDSK